MEDELLLPGEVRPDCVPLAAMGEGLQSLPMPRRMADTAPELLPDVLGAWTTSLPVMTGSGLLADATMLLGRAYPVMVPQGAYFLEPDVVLALCAGDLYAAAFFLCSVLKEGLRRHPQAVRQENDVYGVRYINAGSFGIHPQHLVAYGLGDAAYGAAQLNKVVRKARGQPEPPAVPDAFAATLLGDPAKPDVAAGEELTGAAEGLTE